MPFGRNGERVAKTPLFSRPPSLGGVTSGVNFSTLFSEKPHIIHKCENSSIPRSASGFWYFGSNTICPAASGTRPLCLGMPNFSPNPVCIIATGSIVFLYIFYTSILFSISSSSTSFFAASRYSFSCRYVCLNGFMDGAISIASKKSCFLMPRVAA